MTQELFASLDEIPWPVLNHNYSTAEDIPQLLRDLASADGDRIHAAFDELFEMVWHPESLSEATPYTVPFIVEIIEKTASPLRADLLILLKELVSEEDISDQERDLAKKVEAAVKAGLPVYLNLIRDEELQAEAIDLLSAFSEACDEIAPQLLALLDEEDNPGTQYILIDSLLKLVSKPGACSDREAYHTALHTIKQSNIKALQLAASRALIKRRATTPDDNSFDIVKDSIISPESYILPHLEPSLLMANTIRTDSLKLLRYLDPEQAVETVESVLDGIQAKAPNVDRPQASGGDLKLYDAMQQSVQQVVADIETQGFDQFEMDDKEEVLKSVDISSFLDNIVNAFRNVSAERFTRSASKQTEADFGLNVLYWLMKVGFGDDLMVDINVKSTAFLPSGDIEFNFSVRGNHTAPNWQEITPLQLRVLKIIASYDLLWRFKTNMLSVHGLPGERQALLAWVTSQTRG